MFAEIRLDPAGTEICGTQLPLSIAMKSNPIQVFNKSILKQILIRLIKKKNLESSFQVWGFFTCFGILSLSAIILVFSLSKTEKRTKSQRRNILDFPTP